MRSLQKSLRLRPWYIKAEVWDFPVIIERTRLISYLIYGLFIMDLSLLSIKNNNWPADTFNKPRHFNELYTWACDTIRWQWSSDALFDSCQLTITWISITMSTAKLNTDSICLGHPASNARSLHENSQSERVHYFSHIIKKTYIT